MQINGLRIKKKFGQSDPFSTVVGHIDSISRDIASMEVLGANPNATINWMFDYLKKTSSYRRSTRIKKKKSITW